MITQDQTRRGQVVGLGGCGEEEGEGAGLEVGLWGRRRYRWRGDVRVMPGYQAVLRRAEYLGATDRNLLRLALEGRHSFRELGLLIGRSAGETCRRVKRLMRRLRDPVVVALIDHPGDLPQEIREVGLAYWVRQRPINKIVEENGQTVVEVRGTIAYVRLWAKMVRRGWGRG